MCPADRQTRAKGYMDFKLFKNIVQQCKGKFSLEKMALMGFGEPFLHPENITMSRYAKEQGIRHVFTSTNATLINQKLAQEIIRDSGFDLLSFSFDGITKATYEKIRVRAEFEKVMANTLQFINLRKKYRKNKPLINMQILRMRETQGEVKDFVKFWNKHLGRRDIIFIRDVDTFGGQVADRRIQPQPTEISRIPCVQLNRDFVISWDGQVTVCCKDIFYKLVIGNLHQDTIAGIWKNDQWNNIRNIHKLKQWDRIALCKSCSEWNQ
jgi:radical SAM protein with 4Fe4S-binding SPASM domain